MSKKKIPTLFALLLLISGAFLGVIFLEQDTSFLPRAAPEYLPGDIRITNISDAGFSISWITKEPTLGYIKLGVGPDELDATILDDRDQLSGENGSFRVHYVTISGLSSNTNYFFKIGSHNNTLYDDDGQAFSVQTGVVLTGDSGADTAYGTILTPAQTPAQHAIVYATIDSSSPLSTLVTQNGSWSINLTSIRSQDGKSLLEYDLDDSTLELLVIDGSNPNTFISTLTSNDQPVSDIIIGQNQNLVTTNSNDDDIPIQPDVIPESKFTFTQLEATDVKSDSLISIESIPEDGFITNQDQPTIQGSAPTNSILTITVKSSPIYTDSVTVDDFGNWSWQPPGYLEEGDHQITITYTDADGILHTLERNFVVASAEESNSPSYAATPSATITTTPAPEPTSTPLPSPTSVPQISPSPTPSISPTIIRTSNPSTESGIPTAGIAWPLYSLLIFGTGFVGIGYLLSRKIY